MVVLALLAAVLAATQVAHPAIAPDPVPRASAVIGGTVTAAGSGTPLARVRVSVSATTHLPAPRVALTDAAGQFEVANLPPGLYTVTFLRSGYVTRAFPSPVEVAERQRLERVDIALERAAIIRGRILDEDGTPLGSARVSAWPAGKGTPSPGAPVATTTTDDRGEFRLIGLPPGPYFVSAMDQAFESASDSRGRPTYAPTYYPGAESPATAAAVHARLADVTEVPSIEFQVRILPPATVSGRLLTPDRKQLLSAAIIMSPQVGEARITPDGFFTFTDVPPGRYLLRARGETDRNGGSLFARFNVTVQGRDVKGLELPLAPGAVIEGHLNVVTRRGSAAPALTTLRVRAPMADGESFGDTISGAVKSDGSFRLVGLMPGAHVLMVDGLAFPWRISEARVGGLDAVEHAIDLDLAGDGSTRGARVVVSDTAAGVSGTVPLTPGVASDVIVIAFPANPLRRSVPLRFVRVGRVSDAGTFRIVDLVPGDYLVAAAFGLTEADGMRVDVLNRLAAEATAVRLSEGQVAETTLRPPVSAAGTLP